MLENVKVGALTYLYPVNILPAHTSPYCPEKVLGSYNIPET
jgi:hypothetical protein